MWSRSVADDVGPDHHSKLSEDEQEAAGLALLGMLDGDLVPFAHFLSLGSPVPDILRKPLIGMITGEGDPEFRLEPPIRTRRGPGTALSRLRTSLRDQQIAGFIRERLPLSDGKLEPALVEAMDEFGEKRGVIVAAWSRFGKQGNWFDWLASWRE